MVAAAGASPEDGTSDMVPLLVAVAQKHGPGAVNG